METAWIQIFILTFAECVAPAGKTVCQEQQFELQFLNKADCEYALQQLVAAKDQADYVIVNRNKSACAPSAVESRTYASLEAINDAYKDTAGWRAPGAAAGGVAVGNSEHRARLANLKSCEETGGTAPCKIGDIIVEEASGDSVEIWKRD
jgi:hypothetical protein